MQNSPPPQIFRLRCSGERHRIGLTARGSIILYDHILQREMIWMTLQQEAPPCYAAYLALRAGTAMPFSNKFGDWLRQQRKIGRDRSAAAEALWGKDSLRQPLIYRVHKQVQDMFLATWKSCSAYPAQDHAMFEVHCDRTNIYGYRRSHASYMNYMGVEHPRIAIMLPMHWYGRVCRLGYAITEGHMCVSVRAKDPKHRILLRRLTRHRIVNEQSTHRVYYRYWPATQLKKGWRWDKGSDIFGNILPSSWLSDTAL